jgi:hypothetical protein
LKAGADHGWYPQSEKDRFKHPRKLPARFRKEIFSQHAVIADKLLHPGMLASALLRKSARKSSSEQFFHAERQFDAANGKP